MWKQSARRNPKNEVYTGSTSIGGQSFTENIGQPFFSRTIFGQSVWPLVPNGPWPCNSGAWLSFIDQSALAANIIGWQTIRRIRIAYNWQKSMDYYWPSIYGLQSAKHVWSTIGQLCMAYHWPGSGYSMQARGSLHKAAAMHALQQAANLGPVNGTKLIDK